MSHRISFAIGTVVLAGGFIAGCSATPPSHTDTPPAATHTAPPSVPPPVKVTIKPPVTQSATTETAAQANAREAAAGYLAVDAFSRQGLIDQLVQFDKYAAADATYGVDAQNADWNAQAVAAAKNYLSIDSFSHRALVDQLVQFDKFTPAQAEAGVTGAGL